MESAVIAGNRKQRVHVLRGLFNASGTVPAEIAAAARRQHLCDVSYIDVGDIIHHTASERFVIHNRLHRNGQIRTAVLIRTPDGAFDPKLFRIVIELPFRFLCCFRSGDRRNGRRGNGRFGRRMPRRVCDARCGDRFRYLRRKVDRMQINKIADDPGEYQT